MYGGIHILRVIAGTAKGHKLKTIKGMTTRPTADKVKGSLFNILSEQIPGADVIDLFAGTGNLGIEALSRGAHSSFFVDRSRECAGVIKDNLIHTKLAESGVVITDEVESAILKLCRQGKLFNLILLDPPYKQNLVHDTLLFLSRNPILHPQGLIVAEHHTEDLVPDSLGSFILTDRRKYGETTVSFYGLSMS